MLFELAETGGQNDFICIRVCGMYGMVKYLIENVEIVFTSCRRPRFIARDSKLSHENLFISY